MVMPQGGSIIPTSKGMGINLMWKQEVDHDLENDIKKWLPIWVHMTCLLVFKFDASCAY
jgi:hypothetical protein